MVLGEEGGMNSCPSLYEGRPFARVKGERGKGVDSRLRLHGDRLFAGITDGDGRPRGSFLRRDREGMILVEW